MKKINLFNRNINSPQGCREQTPLSMGKGCPVERGGVWACWRNAPRITPSPFGATPSWKEGERKVPSYRRMPVSSGFNRGGGLPLFSGMTAVIFALFIATPSFAAPTELDKKTVASKAYVDTKQDIIETGLVEFDGDFMLPAITTYDSTSGLVANKIGILDHGTVMDSSEGYLNLYGDSNNYGSEMDNYVPTVRAVAEALQVILDNMPNWTPLTWNNTQSTAINAYNTTFGTGTNNWAENGGFLINGQFLANSLALKQNKIPAGTAGNVVTYSGTAGTVGSVATANAPTYNETTGVLENGTNIATIAAVDTRQKKMTCAGWDSETHTDEHCWLWSIE